MIDLFAGAGGFSEGFRRVCERRGIRFKLAAINHWPVAVQTHTLNHPTARHYCESVYEVDPNAVAEEPVDCITASPECIYHSNAKGGGPCDDQSRSGANDILRWLRAIIVKHNKKPTLVVENVREFMKWGPLDENNLPIKARAGETFNEFCAGLRALGYTVDYAVLNSANYGAYTARERLFMLACPDGIPFAGWPEFTHVRTPDRPFVQQWHAARDIIDWSLQGESLALRQAGLLPGKKPLVENTLKRIVYGLEHISGIRGAQLEPFLVMLYGTGKARDLCRPLPTVTTSGNHMALAQPMILPQQRGYDGLYIRSTEQPLPTLTVRSMEGLLQPMLVHSNYAASGERRVQSVERPLPTLTTKSSIGLVQPFLDQMYGNSRPTTLDKPLPTVTAGRGHHSVIEPFYTEHYGNGSAVGLRKPLHTITTHDRFSLCQPVACDIMYRLLEPHELAAGMGFAGYKFAGGRTEVKKQIGNAVEVNQSVALAERVIENWLKVG